MTFAYKADESYPAPPPRFKRQIFNEIAPASGEYIVKGLIPGHGVGFLVGASGSFKTFCGIDWSLRIAGGQTVLDRKTAQCGVVYFAAEAPNGARKRVAAWRKVNGNVDRPFHLVEGALSLLNADDIAAFTAEIRAASAEMAPARLGLILIDTMAAATPGANENSSEDMGLALAHAQAIAAESGAFVMLVAHLGKDEGRGIRGWSGQYAGADCVIYLSREEGARLSVGRVAKLKEGEDGDRFAFSLDQVTLGYDDDGDEITSAVPIYESAPDAEKVAKVRKITAAEAVVLSAIGHVTDNGPTHRPPLAAQGVQAWQKAVTRTDVRTRSLATGFAEDGARPGTVRMQFSRAIQGLVAAKKIRVEGESLWLI